MDFEKRYREAMGRAKEYMQDGRMTPTKTFAEYIFPELKESEDEKIRKTLIELFSGVGKKDWRDIPTEKIIAWLEKQGEQKPTWSDEDENVLEDIEEAIINYWHGDTKIFLLDWLKSLKERLKNE